jgi:hypothetical protein
MYTKPQKIADSNFLGFKDWRQFKSAFFGGLGMWILIIQIPLLFILKRGTKHLYVTQIRNFSTAWEIKKRKKGKVKKIKGLFSTILKK